MSDPIIGGAPDTGDNADGDQGGQQSAAGAGGQGDLPEREWMKGLPEPLRVSKTLRKFADIGALGKSYEELEGKLGKSVVVPDPSAKAEEWEKFFSRIGRPQTPEEYETPQNKFSKEFEKTFRERAFKSGWTKAQFREAISTIVEHNESTVQGYKGQLAREEADVAKQLKTEYGKDYDERVRLANVAAVSLFSEDVRTKLKDSGLFGNVEFVKSLVNLGENFGETGLLRGLTPQGKKKDPYDWMYEKYGGGTR